MTRPFSVVIGALEVAFGISFLLSLGYWGEHRSILRRPDGTEDRLVRYLRGFSRCTPSGIRQSSRKLQIGAAVDLLQSVKTELADPRSAQPSAGVPGLMLDPVDDLIESPGIDVALVRGANERAEELLVIERLDLSVPLDHLEDFRDGALVGREAMTARAALAATPKRGAGVGLAGLEDGGRALAAGTVHCLKSTEV
jgi:hypothetical protein